MSHQIPAFGRARVGAVMLACSILLTPGPASAQQTASLQDMAGQLAGRPGETTIYVAREFITMDPVKPRAQAVAVRDGLFVVVGTKAEVEAAAGNGARVDTTFADKVVMAGFVEQHVHPVLAALTMNTKVISIEEWDTVDGFSAAVRDEKTYEDRLQKALAGHRDKTKPFVSWGYHHYFHGNKMSREYLNRLAPDFPVIIWHRSCHEFFLNDAALKAAGIDKAFVDGFAEERTGAAEPGEGPLLRAGGDADPAEDRAVPRDARVVQEGSRVHRVLLPPERHHAGLRARRVPVQGHPGPDQLRPLGRRDAVQPLLHGRRQIPRGAASEGPEGHARGR